MKKIFYILLTILAAVIVFLIILFLFSLNKSKGALQITSTPKSKVYLNGKYIGDTPLCKCDIKDMIVEGEYTLELIPLSGGYDSFKQRIQINPRVLTVVDKNYAQKDLGDASIIGLTQIENKTDAQISVVTFPEGAKVFLDNDLKGKSSILLKNVKDSDHEIKVSKDGFKDKIVRIRSVPGYRLDVLIYLGLNQNFIASKAGITPSLISTDSSKLDKVSVVILNTPTGFLRVRQLPSLSAAEISQVAPGEKYLLLDEQDGWFKIQLADEKFGWISTQYAQKTN